MQRAVDLNIFSETAVDRSSCNSVVIDLARCEELRRRAHVVLQVPIRVGHSFPIEV